MRAQGAAEVCALKWLILGHVIFHRWECKKTPKCTGTHPGKGAKEGRTGLPPPVSSWPFPMPHSDPTKPLGSGSGACVVENGLVGMAV